MLSQSRTNLIMKVLIPVLTPFLLNPSLPTDALAQRCLPPRLPKGWEYTTTDNSRINTRKVYCGDEKFCATEIFNPEEKIAGAWCIAEPISGRSDPRNNFSRIVGLSGEEGLYERLAKNVVITNFLDMNPGYENELRDRADEFNRSASLDLTRNAILDLLEFQFSNLRTILSGGELDNIDLVYEMIRLGFDQTFNETSFRLRNSATNFKEAARIKEQHGDIWSCNETDAFYKHLSVGWEGLYLRDFVTGFSSASWEDIIKIIFDKSLKGFILGGEEAILEAINETLLKDTSLNTNLEQVLAQSNEFLRERFESKWDPSLEGPASAYFSDLNKVRQELSETRSLEEQILTNFKGVQLLRLDPSSFETGQEGDIKFIIKNTNQVPVENVRVTILETNYKKPIYGFRVSCKNRWTYGNCSPDFPISELDPEETFVRYKIPFRADADAQIGYRNIAIVLEFEKNGFKYVSSKNNPIIVPFLVEE